ncbi:MAG: CPBP family intramembrane metalloprotease [Oscillospiraceae bacterium]|nr:CPBP family intramembrane metalloprotease [Oscillospiraceae bacterium]
MSTEPTGSTSHDDFTESQMPNIEHGKPTIDDYKIVCIKLGLVMLAYFICRIIGAVISSVIWGMADNISQTAAYIIIMSLTVVLVYIIPMLFTAFIFRSFSYYNMGSETFRTLYKRDKRLASALGTFPAMYGLGYGVALLTLLASFLLSRVTGGETFISDLLRPAVVEPATGLGSAIMMVFMLVVIAPVFEEVWVRGIMYDALKPFGHGIAIIISSILFGLMHGSLYMLFYTTILGFALGYIRYATNSLLIVTILHAIFNAVAAGLLFLMALTDITLGENRLINTVSNIYVLAVLVLIVVGLVAFIVRIPIIRKYKIENTWTEISAGKKIALFFFSVPVIIMLVFAFNELTGHWLLGLLLGI